MREYRLLFCFSGDISALIDTVIYNCDKLGCKVVTEKLDKEMDLCRIPNIDMFDTIIIQQYFDMDNPIGLEYLTKLMELKRFNIVCIFDEEKRKEYSYQLYSNGLYSCYFGNDATKITEEEFVKVLINGRSEEEAQSYYGVQLQNDFIDNSSCSNERIPHLIKAITEKVLIYKNDEETLAYEIEKVIECINDYDIRMILTELDYSTVELLLCVPRIFSQYKKIAKVTSSIKVNKQNIDKKYLNDDVKYIPVNCKNIGIVNLSRGAGATFFTMNFACAVGEYMKVSVVEHPLLRPYMYLSLGLNTLCYEGYVDFTSFAHLIDKNETIYGKPYIHNTNKNISWIISDATKYQINSWNSTKLMRLLYVSKDSTINLVDLGDKLFDNSVLDIVEQFNMIIVIIDPMVPELIGNIDYLKKIKRLQENRSLDIRFVINKFSNGIDKMAMLDFLEIEPLAYVPYIEPKYVYGAVYDGNIQYNNSNVKSLLYPPFKKIIDMIIPKETMISKKPFWRR